METAPYYGNNGYFANTPNQYSFQQTPQMFSPVLNRFGAQPAPMNTVPTIMGKQVENKDIVAVTEVPMGGAGVFPKADLSEIYVKVWNKNGKTDIFSYTLTDPQKLQNNEMSVDTLISQLVQKISSLEQKIDNLTLGQTAAATSEKGNSEIVPQQQSQASNGAIGGF